MLKETGRAVRGKDGVRVYGGLWSRWIGRSRNLELHSLFAPAGNGLAGGRWETNNWSKTNLTLTGFDKLHEEKSHVQVLSTHWQLT